MKRFLSTKLGKAKYLLRQITAEPVYGQIKFGRNLRQVLRRGLEKNQCLWKFDAAVHNILKIFRHALRSGITSRTTAITATPA